MSDDDKPKRYGWIEPARAREIHEGIVKITKALEMTTSGLAEMIVREDQYKVRIAELEEIGRQLEEALHLLLKERREILGPMGDV